MASLYDILGLSSNASSEDVKKAFQKLARQWHPDRNLGYESEAVNKFTEISEAYDVLSDDRKRRHYDTFCATGIPQVSSYHFPHPQNGFSFQLNVTDGRLYDSPNEEFYKPSGSLTDNSEQTCQLYSNSLPRFCNNSSKYVESTDPQFAVSAQRNELGMSHDSITNNMFSALLRDSMKCKRKSSSEDIIVIKKPKLDEIVSMEMES